MEETKEVTLKERAIIWLSNQGISTVLLVVLLGMLWTAWPKAIELFQEGYDRNAAQLERAFETHSKNVDRIQDYAQREK